MASAKFLEEALSTDVDESAVNAIVGSLETQLVTSTPAALNSQGQSVSVQQNHINTSISNGARGSTLKHGVSNNGSDSINTILNSDASKSVTTDHHNAVNSVVASLQAGAHSGAYINQLNSGIGILPSSLTGVNKSSDGVKLVYPSSSQTAASVNNRICYPNQSVTLPNGNIGVSSSLPANSSQTVPQSFSQANSNNVNKVNTPSGMDQNKPTGTALVIKSGSNSSQSSATIPTMTLTGTTNTMPGATSSGVSGVVLSKPASQGVGTQAMVGNSPQIVPSNSVQIVNVNALRAGAPAQPGAKTITQRVMIPHMIGARPGQPGHITLQTLQGLGPGTQGHLLLKTENGQYQLLRVGPASGAQGGQAAQMSGNNVNTTFRVQTITGAATQGGVQSQVPSLVTQSSATSTPNSVVTGRGAVDQTKEKCRKFLANLLELSTRESKTVERSVRTLIQELVDTKVEPEQFCDRLERLLNASPQPCLIGFLKKSLPLLRQSMVNNELVIEGIRPPPLSVIQSTPVITSQVRSQFQMTANPQMKVINQQVARPVQQVQRIITPMRMGTSGQVVTSGLKTGVATIRSPGGSNLRPQIVRTPTIQLRPGQHLSKGPFTTTARPLFTSSTASSQFAAPSLLKSGQQAVQIKEKKTFSSSGYVGDDDINDVAAMGGVNLAEESQRILGSTEFVGTQIRSCKDELFLHTVPLINRIARIAKKHGLDDPNLDVASLISHATQERLKTLVEKLAVIAEHRIDFNKADPKYEVSQDVRTQLKCLEEVDRAERKRHEEQERELLLRAAKSRTKPEDPEQQKLKAKAKEMQRAEMEELRQREANLTALLAIGPRKKAKLEEGGASSSSSTLGSGSTNLGVGLRPRTKRVCLRDVLVMLEQEKETSRSNLLYKSYFK